MASGAATLAIAAIGETIVILTGGFDLSAGAVISLCRQIGRDTALSNELSKQALQLHETLFNPDRLQSIFVGEIETLVAGRANQ